MNGPWLAACAFALALVGCSGEPVEPPREPSPMTEPPATRAPPPLGEAVEAKLERIRTTAEAGRLLDFSRMADAEPGFVSNFAGERHYTHWDLLRRTGVDPLAKVVEVLDQPYAATRVGDEVWYVWPDLAARPPEDLLPERLNFRDRARLRDLLGDSGVELIRSGLPYPGFRLAVAEDGRWVYFLHEAGEEETTE